MLIEKKISVTAKTVVDDVEIANHGAVIDTADGDISFYTRQIDKQACKDHRSTVRAEQAEFEDFVYELAEGVKSAK